MDGKTDLSGLAGFDKSQLKSTKTVEKQVLPSAEDIANEKK